MDHNQFGPQGMMFPLVMTPNYYPVPPQQIPEAQVPARIKVAIGALQHFTEKTAIVPLPTKLGSMDSVDYEPMPGQKLTVYEQNLQKAACETIEEYVRGRLRPGVWERPPAVKPAYMTLRIPCPNCRGSGARQNTTDCSVCGGTGAVLIARETRAGTKNTLPDEDDDE